MAISINSDNGNILAGGNDTDGDLVLKGHDGQYRIHLDAGGSNVYIGGNGADGDIVMMPGSATGQSLAASTIHLDADGANIWAGSNGADGDLVLLPATATTKSVAASTIHLDAGNGNIFAGGHGVDGDLVLRNEAGAERIHLDAGGGNIFAGGQGADGDLVLRNEAGAERIHLDAGGGNIFAGGTGADGDLVLRAETGQDRIRLDAGGGNIWVGGNGADGDLLLFAAGGDNQTTADATIHLNGDTGDIILRNADCAEEFDVVGNAVIEAGTVLVIQPDGKLAACDSAYDSRVAGIVSGAGDYRPGIILDRQATSGYRAPVALMGKVFCKVDASENPVQVGDMLTTSTTPGHAMRAADPLKAFGAVVGKALRPLASGTGLIPVLVTMR